MHKQRQWVDEWCVGEPAHKRTAYEGHAITRVCWQCAVLMTGAEMHRLGSMTKDGAESDMRRIFRKAFVSYFPSPLSHYVTLYYKPNDTHYAMRVRPGSRQMWFGMCIASAEDHGKAMAAVMGDMARLKKKADRKERSREQQRAFRIAQEAAKRQMDRRSQVPDCDMASPE